MIQHWSNIEVHEKPEVVRFDGGRVQQWGINITIWYNSHNGSQLPTATLSDLKRLRRAVRKAIHILENENK